MVGTMGNSRARAVFLDRDGVINDNTAPVNHPQDLRIYPAAKAGLQLLHQAGYLLFIVTNQGGIELGYLSEAELQAIHHELLQQLQPYCKITDIKYCPHYYRQCSCRKPQPGMVLELAGQYNVSLSSSWMVGDRESDIEAGRRAGCRTAKIGRYSDSADINAPDLLDAARQIIAQDTGEQIQGSRA